MLVFVARTAGTFARSVCLAAALAGSGCLGSKPLPTLLPVPTSAAMSVPKTGVRASSDDHAALADANWVRSVQLQGATQPPRYHWRHAALDDLLARAASRRPDFFQALADKDPVVVTNAAIALSRLGNGSGARQLADTVRAPQRSMAVRCAAAEALADIRQPAIANMLRELLDQYGRYNVAGASSVYNAELHGELIRGLSWQVDPGEDPRFAQALGSPTAAVRLEAVRLWAGARPQPLPVAVCDHRADSDPRVRAAVLRIVAQRGEAGAQAWFITALSDSDVQVRLAATAALGQTGDAEAVAQLAKLLNDTNEMQRAAAVAALAAAGSRTKVLGAIGDRSPVVRAAVADALVHYADRDGAAAAASLLDDSSTDVQRRLFAAISAWPLPQAGPLLLAALEKPGYLARRTAAAQLAARWPPAAEFPVEGPKQRRTEVAAALQNRFRQEFGFVDAGALAQTLATDRNRPTVTLETLDRLHELIRDLADRNTPEPQRAAALAALAGFGPELTPALERLVLERKLILPEAVYREVLPKRDPSFADIEGLASGDLAQRRRAAESLAARGVQRPLTTLATLRLTMLLLKEPDEQVWRNAMAAVATEPSEAAIQLAYAAIGHPAPEVRRRACLHLAAHPDPLHAKVLLPALDDPNRSVAAAAVEALSRLGRLDDPEPLRRLMRGDSEPLRLAAAVALARLGDPQGRDAVQRMAYHADPIVRRQAAMVLGEMDDAANVATLVALLDDRPAVCRAALDSLTKVVGRNMADVEGQPPANTTEQIRRWKEWFDRQQAESAGKQTVVPDRYGR